MKRTVQCDFESTDVFTFKKPITIMKFDFFGEFTM